MRGRHCKSSCEDSDCSVDPINTGCGQSILLGGVYANAQCPTEGPGSSTPGNKASTSSANAVAIFSVIIVATTSLVV